MLVGVAGFVGVMVMSWLFHTSHRRPFIPPLSFSRSHLGLGRLIQGTTTTSRSRRLAQHIPCPRRRRRRRLRVGPAAVVRPSGPGSSSSRGGGGGEEGIRSEVCEQRLAHVLVAARRRNDERCHPLHGLLRHACVPLLLGSGRRKKGMRKWL